MALDLNDKTANGNNLTNHGATEVAGQLGASAQHGTAASSQYLEAADSASLHITSDLTVEFWLKPDTNPSNTNNAIYVARHDLSATSADAYGVHLNNGGSPMTLFVDITSGTVTDYLSFSHTPTTGAWHHYGLVWTASTKKAIFYLDGVVQGTSAAGVNGAINAGTYPLRLNCRSDSAVSFYDGAMDDVRIWSAARTANQISTNYNLELVGNEANLVAYYPFNSLGATANNYRNLLGVGI